MNLSELELAATHRHDVRPALCGDSFAVRYSFPRTAATAGASSRLTRVALALVVLVGPVALGGGCNSGAGNNPGSASGNPAGSVIDHTDPSLGSLHFVVDANQGGRAGHPRVIGLSWGRLANVYDSTGTLQQQDMVIGRDIPSVDPVNLEFTVNPVTWIRAASCSWVEDPNEVAPVASVSA
jgi:hypothetical protein